MAAACGKQCVCISPENHPAGIPGLWSKELKEDVELEDAVANVLSFNS